MAPAMAQTYTVYAGQISQLSVVQVQGETYAWDLYINDVTVNFAITPGNCPPTSAYFNGADTGSLVSITWLQPGIYYYRLIASDSCSQNLRMGEVVVLEALPTATLAQPPPVCLGDTTQLSIQLTGLAPWTIDLSDGTTTTTYDSIVSNPFIINVAPTVTTSYTVTRVSDANGENTIPSNTVTLIVKPRPVTSPIVQYGP